MKIQIYQYGNKEDLLNSHKHVELDLDDDYARAFPIEYVEQRLDKSKVDNAECMEILVNDVIDFFSATNVEDFIKVLLRKLRHGGTIIIGGVDLYETTKAYYTNTINMTQMNELVHGIDGKKSSNITLPIMVQFLQGQGLKILKKRANHYRFTVVAKRL